MDYLKNDMKEEADSYSVTKDKTARQKKTGVCEQCVRVVSVFRSVTQNKTEQGQKDEKDLVEKCFCKFSVRNVCESRETWMKFLSVSVNI